jgi:hypothetical protein
MSLSHFQLGNNATASNNITLRGNGDGSLSICTGNPGSELERVKFTRIGGIVTKAPTQTKLTSGSGTYTTPTDCRYIRVRMVGGGGGGGGGDSSVTNKGVDGGTTTFGTALLTANGGLGGRAGSTGVAGGTASLAAPAVGIAFTGSGGGATGCSVPFDYPPGGQGGPSPFGGAGSSGINTYGSSAADNTGSGGGGGGCSVYAYGAGGGGAGGYVEALITNPAASYSYAIGAGGAGGPGGNYIYRGGDGAAGVIIIDEYYV